MKIKAVILATIVVFKMVISASPANAVELHFVWSNNGSGSETFNLDTASITADPYLPDPNDYIEAPITGDSEGLTAVFFGNGAISGNFGIGNFRTAAPFGVNPAFAGDITSGTFFTGTNTNPILQFGPGVVYSVDNGSTLTISAVPEPTTWALILLGFGLVGLAIRKRSEVWAVPDRLL